MRAIATPLVIDSGNLLKVHWLWPEKIKSPTLYVTQINIVGDSINDVENEKTTKMWHKRLSHISEKG